jgi:hypothetical protein
MSWKFVSAWHEPLRQVLIPPKGNVLATGERADLIRRLPGIGSKAQFIQPSDHCVNMNNKGACDCAETDRALVKARWSRQLPCPLTCRRF